jgi:uncharacterized protein (DUF488 family)
VIKDPALCTIGYEGHSLESYLAVLTEAGVSVLCDVRRNPLSRKRGFSKNALAMACEAAGIRYEHLPELGIASEERKHLRVQADYDALFERYRREWLPEQGEALDRIHAWLSAGERVALTCYEHLANQCHRQCVAEELEARLGSGSKSTHL